MVISLAGTLPASDASLVDAARRAFAAGDVATTERLCQQALSVSPKDGNAWLLLTETALRRNRPDAAIVCAERAAALLPDDPIAPILRAKCLFVSGEFGLALEAAEATTAKVGTQPEALDALGAMFGMLGHHRRAEALFRRTVALHPDAPQYRFNLAATERTIGEFAAAEAECEAAISLDRRYCLAHYLRSDLRSQTPDRNHTAEMEALIGEGQIGPGGETLLRFALGKEFEDLGEHARAFDHISKGCALQRAATQYDPRRDIDEIDAIVRAQNRAWLDACPPGYRDADPIFVVGLPRTGTTLVERVIIASHGGVIAAGETGAFAVELRREMQKPGRPDFAELGRHYIAAAAVFAGWDGRLVDKTLTNYLYCGLIHAALPRAKIVLVHRHPLDTCWAIYKTLFQGHFPFSYDLAELAEYYLAYRRLARHWEAVLPPHVLLAVNYEDIVRDQAATSRRLMEFAGLPWHDNVLQFHESDAPSATASAVQVRRPIYESSIGKWRHQAERLMPLRARLAQAIPEAELA